MSLSKELRGTDSFIWCTKHAVGIGATSTVYVGRYKKTGEQVAIKVFNDMSYSRPRDVQIRELEVVRKLKHKNIVEVVAIEEDHVSKQPVIIMEFCRGGSLLQYLEEPENLFGLSEKEFLTAVKHILDGMKYLRRSGVVHRDIKPGNIMRVKGQDGSYTYKLADFGAARHVEDEETLQSLYGTEEYLRADLYGIAVLRSGGGASYTTTVDLWSLGVTLYQLATGQLPFRPYGGRRNRETMHYLITRKAPGVISGVQHDSPTGRVEWSKELPTNCHLSRGLKPVVTYMLAHLLESDHAKMWSFQELFEYTDSLTAMKRLDIFNTQTTEVLSVYVSQNADSDEVSLKIAEQSKIAPVNQILCWQNGVFNMEEKVKCKDLPQTQTDTPLILYSKDSSEAFGLVVAPTPALPEMTSAYNLDNDAPIAKMGCACLFFLLGVVIQIQQVQQYTSSAANTFWNVYRDLIRSVQYTKSELQQLQIEVEIRLDMLSRMIRFCIFNIIPDDIDPMIKDIKNTIGNITENLDILTLDYKENFQPDVRGIYHKLDYLAKQNFPHNLDEMRCKDDDKCVERLEELVDNVREIYDQFKKDKREKRLKYNEEQIHKMDKQKLRCKCVQGVSLLRDHCEPKLKTLHTSFGSWYRNINYNMQSLHGLETYMEDIRVKFKNLIRSLNKVEDEIENVLTSSTAAVSSVFTKCVTTAVELKMSRDEVQELNKKFSDTQVASGLTAEDKPGSAECTSPRRIRVPKHIKKQFLSMESDLEKTKQEISESARILEEIRLHEEHMKTVIY